MYTLIFDIETIPDTHGARKLHDFQDLDDNGVANALSLLRRQETNGSDFLRLPLHRIVTISLVLYSAQHIKVWSLSSQDHSEKDIIQRFFDGIEKYTPMLVSWNGTNFDLPVLHYRSLLHGVHAARYFETGEHDNSFRWNNYLNRYHDRHLDLMDVLASYQPRAYAALDDIACLLGFPGKMGMSGSKVWEYYQQGLLQEINDYCELDVLNTFLIYLRFQLIRGQLSSEQYAQDCHRLRSYLEQENKAHFTAFLQNWQ